MQEDFSVQIIKDSLNDYFVNTNDAELSDGMFILKLILI